MKKEFLEKMRNDESYQTAMRLARSDAEREKLSRAAESMFDALSEIFLKFNDLGTDPEKMKKVVEELREINRKEV